jgi:hypothetical protein
MVPALLLGVLLCTPLEASQPDVTIGVFVDHYVFANRVVDDLDLLEERVDRTGARTVRLDACGAGAERAQRAAAYRFRQRGLELRIVDLDAPACASNSAVREVSATWPRGAREYGINNDVVDRWWHLHMP